MEIRIRLFVLVVVLNGSVSAAVLAQVAPQPWQPSAAGGTSLAPGYDAIIDQALSEYQARNFEEALALFSKAHALSPNARTLRGMAMAEYELRRYVTCIAHLQEALVSQAKPITGSLRTETEELLYKAQQYVSRVMVWLSPATASIVVDGAPVVLPADGALMLQVGERVLDVQAEGFQPERRTLRLVGGENQQLNVALRPNSSRVVVQMSPPTANARVTVDGAPAVFTPDGALMLQVGERVVDVQAEGFQVERRTLRLSGGENQTLSITLRPLAAPSAALAEAPVTSSAWSSPWLWTGVGVVVAGGVVAAVLLTQPQSEAKKPVSGDVGGVVQALSWR